MFSIFTADPDNPINIREYSLQMIRTSKFGLPKCTNQQNGCQQIGIVGAGAAGLYCGILLTESGRQVTIYEGNNRAGGRVFTYRHPNNHQNTLEN